LTGAGTDPLPEKTKIALQFSLPENKDKIQVLAEVVWCREKDERPSLPPGMGVRFLKIKARDRKKIERFVQEYYKEQEEKKKASSGK